MANLVEWIKGEAGGEEIESVIIGKFGWNGYNDEIHIPEEYIGKALSWEMAKKLLNYDFDDSYGAPGCHAICAYTASWIISVYQYDGATSTFKMPRNPVDGFIPDMPGG